MKYKTEIFLSNRILPDYKQVPVPEAEKWLEDKGYRFIHIDNDGIIHARSQHDEAIEGYRLYMRDIPDLGGE